MGKAITVLAVKAQIPTLTQKDMWVGGGRILDCIRHESESNIWKFAQKIS